ncbi:hypothetical protein [Vagococcus fluvialis]|uniref:Uncharacterized protein n=1 Tax=Vagococcus fluvialis TaxID=2738 RepID=A0A7X6D9P6_9ENTE|nr:hypothetical protein [Vagococcus fluvialis]NKC68043.1 hypothetical protein [Vagococcus fluvialis]
MSQQMLIVIVIILVCLVLYMVWSVKYQSKMGTSGNYKNFGFSYIGIAQVVNLLISIVAGIIPTTFASTKIQMNQMILLGIVLGLVLYYLLNFSIVKFRNTAIIAKTNTEVLKKLEQLYDAQEENNGEKN